MEHLSGEVHCAAKRLGALIVCLASKVLTLHMVGKWDKVGVVLLEALSTLRQCRVDQLVNLLRHFFLRLLCLLIKVTFNPFNNF